MRSKLSYDVPMRAKTVRQVGGSGLKTKERVLVVSLDLFNTYGEPNVTTLQIADEMDISPGNLYYHYKNKTEIVAALFHRFEEELSDLLDVPEVDIGIEDAWLFLHLMFECIARYQFLYKDLVNILHRYEKISGRFRKLLLKKHLASLAICQSFARQGFLETGQQEVEALCRNMVLAMTYWPSYDIIREAGPEGNINLSQGVYQIMAMIAPHLRENERKSLQEISAAYL